MYIIHMSGKVCMYCTLYIISYHINPDPLTKLIHAFKRRFLGFIDPTMHVLLQSLQKCNFMTCKNSKKPYETMLQTKLRMCSDVQNAFIRKKVSRDLKSA